MSELQAFYITRGQIDPAAASKALSKLRIEWPERPADAVLAAYRLAGPSGTTWTAVAQRTGLTSGCVRAATQKHARAGAIVGAGVAVVGATKQRARLWRVVDGAGEVA